MTESHNPDALEKEAGENEAGEEEGSKVGDSKARDHPALISRNHKEKKLEFTNEFQDIASGTTMCKKEKDSRKNIVFVY